MLYYYNSVALTKIDLLDTFDEIKLGVSYKLHGKVLVSFPGMWYVTYIIGIYLLHVV